ncbi:hypothetical protein [Nocardioides sp.]|uniref:hypothetical protein n=1 Tax=Nocardioides sp. TaxID=35761 RepID=UPI003782D609
MGTMPAGHETQIPERPPRGLPRLYRTAFKVGLAALGLITLMCIVHATGVLSPKPLTYEAPWVEDAENTAPTTVSPEGRHVTVRYSGGACDQSADANVEESPTQVTITVVVTEQRGESCPAMGVFRTITVTLDSPLGSRRLVDGSHSS